MSQAAPPIPYEPRTSGKAISSLLLGISSFLCWIFTGLPAIILGAIALRDIRRSNGQLRGDGLAIAGIVTGSVSSFVILPILILVALLFPAIHAARDAARRNIAMNNMKQIMLAMFNYENAHKEFPPAGGPGSQLSWRVHVLPFFEEGGKLYEQFHLDEPWDSEHNRTLIAKMPEVFRDPNDRLPPGETPYLVVTGPGTAFDDGTKGVRLRSFGDGLSNTIMLVEADPSEATVWTRPDDWQFDPNDPTRGLGAMRPGGFLATMGDGAVLSISEDTPAETIKAMMTRAGGENVGPPVQRLPGL